MLLRATLIAAVMTVGGAAFAEAPKSAPVRAAQAQSGRDVVLASAETLRAPAPDAAQPSPAPTKRRIARVTTCRCGEPQPDPDSQDQ